jgi:two-component system, chemotaxis family, chemotaxis protein CheY
MSTAVIIDDSALLRLQMRQILTRIGVTVVGEGSSGDHACELYAQHRPDLVTLDIVMPGKDGVAAAIEIIRDFPGARIVMCTSLTARDKVIACQRAGVSYYLLKPFDDERAARMLEYVLQRPAHDSPHTRPAAHPATSVEP